MAMTWESISIIEQKAVGTHTYRIIGDRLEVDGTVIFHDSQRVLKEIAEELELTAPTP
jgi:hypothetical protein